MLNVAERLSILNLPSAGPCTTDDVLSALDASTQARIVVARGANVRPSVDVAKDARHFASKGAAWFMPHLECRVILPDGSVGFRFVGTAETSVVVPLS